MLNNDLGRGGNGFTIVEVIIVVVVVGILASIFIATDSTSMARGRDSERSSDVKNIARQFESYYRRYPTAKGATYPSSAQMTESALLKIITDRELLIPPGQSTPSFKIATSKYPQTPTKDEYIYQPLDDKGDLCTGSTPCARFFIYYKKETENNTSFVYSMRQQ